MHFVVPHFFSASPHSLFLPVSFSFFHFLPFTHTHITLARACDQSLSLRRSPTIATHKHTQWEIDHSASTIIKNRWSSDRVTTFMICAIVSDRERLLSDCFSDGRHSRSRRLQKYSERVRFGSVPAVQKGASRRRTLSGP